MLHTKVFPQFSCVFLLVYGYKNVHGCHKIAGRVPTLSGLSVVTVTIIKWRRTEKIL